MAPFHSMVDHFLYHNNQNRNEPTMFNWIGVSPSYNSGRGARNLLNGYEVELSVSDNVPMSTHFTWRSFTMCAFGNADYSEKSSQADTDSRYVSKVLLQDASERLLPKITGSSSNASSKVSCSLQLPCQVVGPYKKPPTRTSLLPDVLLSLENCIVEHLDT